MQGSWISTHRTNPRFCASALFKEIGADDRRSEVGYLDRSRVVLNVVESPLTTNGRSEWQPAPGEPILVTGGARGSRPSLATEMAKTCKPTFLLVGTTPAPSSGEPTHGRGDEPNDIEVLAPSATDRRRGGASLTDLERAYQTLRRQRGDPVQPQNNCSRSVRKSSTLRSTFAIAKHSAWSWPAGRLDSDPSAD